MRTAIKVGFAIGVVLLLFSGARSGLASPPDAMPSPTSDAGVPNLVLKWKADLGIDPNANIVSNGAFAEITPVIANGLIYVTMSNSSLAAIDAETGQLRWRFDSGLKAIVDTTPAIISDMVVFGVVVEVDIGPREEDYTLVGYLVAVDARTGQERWRFVSESAYLSAPAASNGLIYFGGTPYVGRTYGPNDRPNDFLYALNARGQLQWKMALPDESVYRDLGQPIIEGRTLYLLDKATDSGDPNRDFVYAIDTMTGRQEWKREVCSHDEYGDPQGVVVAEGIVYATCTNELYALDSKSGRLNWSYRLPDPIRKVATPAPTPAATPIRHPLPTDVYIPSHRIRTLPAIFNGAVIFGINVETDTFVGSSEVYGELDFYLLALDAHNGKEMWRYKTDDEVTRQPVAEKGIVYFDTFTSYIDPVYSDTSSIYALQPGTQTILWAFKPDAPLAGNSTLSDGVLYISDYDGRLYALLTSQIGMPTAGNPGSGWGYVGVLAVLSLCIGTIIRRSTRKQSSTHAR